MSPQQHFPPDSHVIRYVRQFVSDQVAPSPRADEAVLIASELATNAVIHARTPFSVTVRPGQPIRLEVTDGSTDIPLPVESFATHGLGLHVVSYLARRWGVRTHAHGKTVWVEIENALTNPDSP